MYHHFTFLMKIQIYYSHVHMCLILNNKMLTSKLKLIKLKQKYSTKPKNPKRIKYMYKQMITKNFMKKMCAK